MELNQYQHNAKRFAHYENEPPAAGVNYCALGLAGEGGEVANVMKKHWRDDGGDEVISPERAARLLDEAGDALWYVAMLAEELGCSLEQLARANLAKLGDRYTTKEEDPNG